MSLTYAQGQAIAAQWKNTDAEARFTEWLLRRSYQIVGLASGVFRWMTTDGVGDNAGGAGASGLSPDTFDAAADSQGATIRLLNSSGSDKLLAEAMILGNPVIKISGELGYISDNYVDQNSLQRVGKRVIEVGNDFIVDASSGGQIQKLANYLWKANKSRRKVYSLALPGTRWYLCPGDWCTLTIGAAGQPEYVSATCEIYEVQCERQVGGIGRTSLVLREVLTNYIYDGSAQVRYVGYGDVQRLVDNRIRVASSTSLRPANFYCDGTSDEDQINAAIDMAAVLGGGVVLSEGTFYTDGAIVLKSGVTLEGAGIGATVISRNYNGYAIQVEGTSGTHLSNVAIRGLSVTQADANAANLIYCDYVDGLSVDGVGATDGLAAGIVIRHSTAVVVRGCVANGNAGIGIGCVYSPGSYIGACLCSSNGQSGIYISTDSDGSSAVGNACSGNLAGGLWVNGANTTVSSNSCDGNTYFGINASSCDGSTISANICINTLSGVTYGAGIMIGIGTSDCILTGNTASSNAIYGIQIEHSTCANNIVSGNRATGNGTSNYTDSGTGTTATGNDWT